MNSTSTDLYERLREHIDTMSVPMPKTDSGIELRLLEYLFNHKEAEVALCISALAEPASKIRRRYGRNKMSLQDMEQLLDSMVNKGSIRGGTKKIRGEMQKVYGKLPFAVGMYETQLGKLTRTFENNSREYFHGSFLDDFYKSEPRQIRPIPINEKAVASNAVGVYGDIREIVKNSDGPFAVHDCVCREGRELNGYTCEVTDISERCISLGGPAENILESKLGREITKEELLDLFKTAESEGLVIQANNVKDPIYICCCCKDCCGLLTSINRLPNPGELVASNYRVDITSNECVWCGACLKRCPVDALELVDKKINVLEKRCIGCGLCVSACPKDVLVLKPKENMEIPPADNTQMHRKIFLNRYGVVKAAWLFGKALLGFKL